MTPVTRRRPRRGLVVTVTDGRGRPVPSRALGQFLAAAAPPGADGHLTIALIGDAAMRRLNRQFLGHDYATDVLSFPLSGERNFELRSSNFEVPGPKAPAGPGPGAAQRPLGDLAIARGVARRQARAEGHSLQVELRILALHGLLHLLGYDHDTDQGEMGRLEERLRRRAGLPVGLIARAPGRPPRR